MPCLRASNGRRELASATTAKPSIEHSDRIARMDASQQGPTSRVGDIAGEWLERSIGLANAQHIAQALSSGSTLAVFLEQIGTVTECVSAVLEITVDPVAPASY